MKWDKIRSAWQGQYLPADVPLVEKKLRMCSCVLQHAPTDISCPGELSVQDNLAVSPENIYESSNMERSCLYYFKVTP